MTFPQTAYSMRNLANRSITVQNPVTVLTLDRINNEKVLLLEDVWIVCMRCNVMKNSMTFDEYIEHCRMVVDKFSKR